MSTLADYSQGAAFVRGQYLPMAEAPIPITDCVRLSGLRSANSCLEQLRRSVSHGNRRRIFSS